MTTCHDDDDDGYNDWPAARTDGRARESGEDLEVFCFRYAIQDDRLIYNSLDNSISLGETAASWEWV